MSQFPTFPVVGSTDHGSGALLSAQVAHSRNRFKPEAARQILLNSRCTGGIRIDARGLDLDDPLIRRKFIRQRVRLLVEFDWNGFLVAMMDRVKETPASLMVEVGKEARTLAPRMKGLLVASVTKSDRAELFREIATMQMSYCGNDEVLDITRRFALIPGAAPFMPAGRSEGEFINAMDALDPCTRRTGYMFYKAHPCFSDEKTTFMIAGETSPQFVPRCRVVAEDAQYGEFTITNIMKAEAHNAQDPTFILVKHPQIEAYINAIQRLFRDRYPHKGYKLIVAVGGLVPGLGESLGKWRKEGIIVTATQGMPGHFDPDGWTYDNLEQHLRNWPLPQNVRN